MEDEATQSVLAPSVQVLSLGINQVGIQHGNSWFSWTRSLYFCLLQSIYWELLSITSNSIRVILSTIENYYCVLLRITENYKFSKKFDKSTTEYYWELLSSYVNFCRDNSTHPYCGFMGLFNNQPHFSLNDSANLIRLENYQYCQLENISRDSHW